MPVHEIVKFKSTEAFYADPEGTLKDAAEFFRNTEGILSVHAGVAEEDKTGYIIIAWETYEHHQALMQKPGYPGIIPLEGVWEPDSMRMFHSDLIGDPDEAFSSPVTELLDTSLKKNKKKEDVGAAFDLLTARVHLEEGCSKSSAWGQTREDLRTVYFFCGWESSKRHFAVVGQRSYSDEIMNLFTQVDITMLHIPFKKIVSKVTVD